MLKIVNVVGARPNFMKIAPLIEAMNQHPERINHLLVHTGQHYDTKMSKDFFEDLEIPEPDIELGVGSGTHAEQTARVMMAFENVCIKEKPDLVIVVGDVNSTMACAITAKKLNIKVAHVEAGLRSSDMSMPEEINRLCTDIISDYLFTTDHFADENLENEGILQEKIFFVGNIMIDTLVKYKERASHLNLLRKWDLEPKSYALMTLHRPSNVDDKDTLQGIMEALREIAEKIPIVFPIHPRAMKMVRQFKLDHFFNKENEVKGLWTREPLGYIAFLHLSMNARMVLTDSGGLQEETTFLGVPCITLRENTERPITCTIGTNIIVGNSKEKILLAAHNILNEKKFPAKIPEKWDGETAQRIVEILLEKAT